MAISDMPYTKVYIHRSGLSAILSFVTSTLFSCCPDVVCVSHIVTTTARLIQTYMYIVVCRCTNSDYTYAGCECVEFRMVCCLRKQRKQQRDTFGYEIENLFVR